MSWQKQEQTQTDRRSEEYGIPKECSIKDHLQNLFDEKDYDPGNNEEFPLLPNPLRDQVIVLYNEKTGTTLVADEAGVPSPEDIRNRKPEKQCIISLQNKQLSFNMDVRSSNYATFFEVHVTANIRVKDGARLYDIHKSNREIEKEIENTIVTECYDQARKIGRNHLPTAYIQFEEDLYSKIQNELNRCDYGVFSYIEIVRMGFQVDLPKKYEEVMSQATYSAFENDTKRRVLQSEMANMEEYTKLMASGADADVWLAVAQGRMTATEAIELISSRSQDKRDKEIDVIQRMIDQGVLSDKDMQRYMRSVLDNTVDSSTAEREAASAPTPMLESASSAGDAPSADNMPDLDDEEE